MKIDLIKDLGLDNHTKNTANNYSDLFLGRVSEQHKNIYKVITEKAEVLAQVSGRYSYLAAEKSEFPVVGDWVMLSADQNDQGAVIIHHLLPRRNKLQRKEPGTKEQAQVLAANINFVFICMALNNDFNSRRLERYLTIAWDSNATPVVVLTKKDICLDLEAKLLAIEDIIVGVDVLTTSSNDLKTTEAFGKYLTAGKTAVFVGSSGVGKSTLINLLAGQELLATKEIRKDDRGKHTTTSRQLIVLPKGGIVIDTPGLREIQIETGDIGHTFQDIEELAMKCKFKDCSHNTEPGCAVKAAIQSGVLDPKRFANYQKLSRETEYQSLGSREIENKKIENMFGGKSAYKKMIKEVKKKNKRSCF